MGAAALSWTLVANSGNARKIQDTRTGRSACNLQSGPITAPAGAPAVFVDLLFEVQPVKRNSGRGPPLGPFVIDTNATRGLVAGLGTYIKGL